MRVHVEFVRLKNEIGGFRDEGEEGRGLNPHTM